MHKGRKNYECKNENHIGIIYENHTYKRPHLEWSFQAWRPWLKTDMKLLEDAQMRSTKRIRGLQDIEYEERAQFLNFLVVWTRDT